MKNLIYILSSILFLSCTGSSNQGKSSDIDTVYVHDTVYSENCPNGSFIYNLPCKIVNIHQEQKGKSLLFLWLHGGVHDNSLHDFFGFHHLQCCAADDSILQYLQIKGIKAIALFPVCHKAEISHCVNWKECYYDVKAILNDYISKGLVDNKRIFIAGSSDGGTGTWDFIESHGDIFAAAMPMSCANPRKTDIPVYFFNTSREPDCTQQVIVLNQQGCNIKYKHCAQYKHGGDGAECTKEFLDKFFSNINKKIN